MGHKSTNALFIPVSYRVAALGLFLTLGTLSGVSIAEQLSKSATQTKEEKLTKAQHTRSA